MQKEVINFRHSLTNRIQERGNESNTNFYVIRHSYNINQVFNVFFFAFLCLIAIYFLYAHVWIFSLLIKQTLPIRDKISFRIFTHICANTADIKFPSAMLSGSVAVAYFFDYFHFQHIHPFIPFISTAIVCLK